jgi:hypothetical protein
MRFYFRLGHRQHFFRVEPGTGEQRLCPAYRA